MERERDRLRRLVKQTPVPTEPVLPGFSDDEMPKVWTNNGRFMISFNKFQKLVNKIFL